MACLTDQSSPSKLHSISQSEPSLIHQQCHRANSLITTAITSSQLQPHFTICSLYPIHPPTSTKPCSPSQPKPANHQSSPPPWLPISVHLQTSITPIVKAHTSTACNSHHHHNHFTNQTHGNSSAPIHINFNHPLQIVIAAALPCPTCASLSHGLSSSLSLRRHRRNPPSKSLTLRPNGLTKAPPQHPLPCLTFSDQPLHSPESSCTSVVTAAAPQSSTVSLRRAADGSARRKRKQQQPAASGPLSGADVHTGSSVQFSFAVDDIKSPKSHLEAAINEERSISAREAVVVQQAAETVAAVE
ncbi:hypothetical protein M0R45_016431 [Rubus argutus]|uniref:Uncharacterized protein n=1 Tax=Rubus argutus TaxID=59490 RepID=A0AAW1XT22_RUBAR